MGKFIACMPLTVVAMLLISLVEGFTILPCHLGHEGMLRELIETMKGIRRSIMSNGLIQILAGGWIVLGMAWLAEILVMTIDYFARGFKRFFDQVNRYADILVQTLVHRVYLPVLRFFLRNISLAYALQVSFLLITMTCFAAGWTRYTTFPDMDARVVEAKITFPDGTPAHITDAAVKQAADAIRRIHAKFEAEGKPLVQIVHETIGQRSGLGTFGPEPRDSGEFVGGVYVELVGAEGRDLTSAQIAALWRKETGLISGVETAVFEVQQMGPGGKDIEFKLLAPNEHWADLERAVEDTKKSLIEFGGVFDVTDDSYLGKWEYQIRMNDRGHSMGVTTADLAETVRAAFYGEEVMRLQRGRHEVKLMVRYPEQDRNSIDTLQNIRVRGQDGSERPIAELAEFDVRRGYSEIQRVDQQRAITISANVEESTNAGEVLASLQAGPLKDILARSPEVVVRWEGQKEQDAESVQSLGLGAVVALGAMFILLTFQLQSVIQPLLIIYLIPFAAAGAIWGHIVMGLDVTLFSIFGLVALMGMVVNDSIVLLDFINAQRREFPKESTAYSILEASRRRIRPVALNTVTSVIGLIPLLADQSFQAQALIPMGVSLVFGLATSTVLGLLILPVSYYMVSRAIPLTQVLHASDSESAISETVSPYSSESLVD